jgi:hypothetical protein
MKFIRQISTGVTIYREEPHRVDAKVLGNASMHSGISLSDLHVVDEDLTNEQFSTEMQAARPWEEKMIDTDFGMPRHMEDLITSNSSLVIPAEMKKRYDAKIKIRGEKP